MNAEIARLSRRIAALERRRKVVASPFSRYADDPVGFAREVLKVTPTPQQTAVVEAGMRPPHAVLVSSGNNVGKSFAGAWLVLWHHYCRNGITLTTAPTDRQVKDILWKEVRTLAMRAGLPAHWSGPKMPRLETSPAHFAHGFTARDATRFHGHHSPGGLMVLFDEAEGVAPEFWIAARTMLDGNSLFFAFYNPTSPGSAAHQREEEADQHGTYTRFCLSCLDHPNIKAELAGEKPLIPGAITLGQLETMLLEDSRVISPGEAMAGDVELAGKWYRPGPVAEARCLGRRSTQGTSGLWYELLWQEMLAKRHTPLTEWPVVIGCDVARYGDDSTVIMVRKGFAFLHVETHVKQSTSFVAQRLRELCNQYRDDRNPERRIPCQIDEGGIGGGVIDQADGYRFLPINASRSPLNEIRYKNVRSELWFNARDSAAKGCVDVSRLPPATLSRLKQELMSARYEVDPKDNKNKVLSKDDMKKLLGRSPDLADAFNLTLYPTPRIL